MVGITVITPSLPARSAMLADAMRSVFHQTLRPAVHTIAIDYYGFGPAAVRNDLLEGVLTPWVAFLDDDDLLDPDHLEVLASADLANLDVVISHCRFSGETIPSKYCNRPFDREALRQHGIFPITVLARRKAILDAGGFGDERYEDWALWNRMADNGARFHVIPRVTWTYRLGHGNRTHGHYTQHHREGVLGDGSAVIQDTTSEPSIQPGQEYGVAPAHVGSNPTPSDSTAA